MSALNRETEDRFSTPEDLAKRLGVKPRTLQEWRSRKRGPHFVRLEGFIRYRERDVEEWLDRQTERTLN
jgi:predicted DNA-binding transcriptional regulator AlpA